MGPDYYRVIIPSVETEVDAHTKGQTTRSTHHKEYFSYSKTAIEGRALATDSESLLALIQKHKSQAVSLGDEEAPGEEKISRG